MCMGDHIIGECRRVGLTVWGGMKEKTAMYNNHIMPQEDVGCVWYSRSVMFHAFPVVRRERTRQSLARLIYTTHITGACGRVGLTDWVESKEKTAMYNNHIMLQENVEWACYSRSVMFHASIVVRRENTAVISKLISHTSLEHVEEWDSPPEVEGRRKQQCITTT